MATAKLIIRGTSKSKPHPITLILFYDRTRLKYSTGLSILPDHWNKDREEVRNKIEVVNPNQFNKELKKYKSASLSIYNSLVANGEIVDNQLLREKLNDHFNRNKKEKLTLYYVSDYLKKFIYEAPTKAILKGGSERSPLKPNTIRNFKTTFRRLSEFDKVRKKKTRFTSFDRQYHEQLIAHLTGVEKLSVQSIGSMIKDLKSISKHAQRDGQKVNSFVFTTDFFKPSADEEEKDIRPVYLNENEIDKVYYHDFSKNEKLDNARDLFIVGLWTGLRVSDFTRITEANINNGFINLKQKKTGGSVIIPLHPQIEAIIEKREGKFPKTISHQKFNDYIKEVCEAVKINEQVKGSRLLKTKEGRRKIIGTYPKYELISSHCCRRSFATNLYGELPTLTIMAITGHKTESSFFKYIKTTPEEHAVTLRDYWMKRIEDKKQGLRMVKA